MSDIEELYRSRPLPSGTKSIRVLDILAVPASALNQDTHEIEGNLRVVDLEDDPSFTALSYVWGTFAPNPHHISCSGTQVKITENGHSALRHLRAKLGSFTIWVDALCISQDDLIERSHQIPLMGDVYSKAAEVFIWLGEGNDSTDRAMSWLRTAGFTKYYWGWDKNKVPTEGTSRPFAAAWCAMKLVSVVRGLVPMDSPLITTEWGMYTTISDLGDLLNRPWLERVWTYQEIVLAMHPTIVCGHSHLPWYQFKLGIIFLTYISGPREMINPWTSIILTKESLVATPVSCLNHASDTSVENYQDFIVRFMSHYNGLMRKWVAVWFSAAALYVLILPLALLAENLPLEAMSMGLVVFASVLGLLLPREVFNPFSWLEVMDNDTYSLYYRRATNPKDMVFGFWAILQKRARAQLPPPTYLDTKGTIYTTFTCHFISIRKSLHPLLLAAACNVPGEPSWVPDWSASNKHVWGDLAELARLNVLQSWLCPAAEEFRESSPFFKLDTSRNILTIRARRLCTVSECQKFYPTTSASIEAEKEAHIQNLGMVLKMRALYAKHGTFHGFDDAFDDEMYDIVRQADINYTRHTYWLQFLRANRNQDVQKTLSLLQSAGTMHSRFNPVRWASTVNKYGTYADIQRTHIAICNILAQRKQTIVSTSEGVDGTTVVGFASLDVAVGDQITVIEGVPLPLVVRPCRSKQSQITLISPVVFHTAWTASKNSLRQEVRRFCSKADVEELDIY